MPGDRDRRALDEWPVTWTAHREDQIARMMGATPSQRLAWLEEAIVLAFRSGALPRPETQ